MTTVNHQKKIAVINDLSGYGRCSLTVAIPVISALKVQCCPVPTSILSNHTGFPNYFIDDYTGKLPSYLNEWKKLGLTFDGIYSGFLGSEDQIQIVIDMIKTFRNENTRVIIDPVMGDHGKAYQTFSPRMCSKMKHLVGYGDIVTPNLTEACILTGREYREEGFNRTELADMARELQAMGPSSVIITGIKEGPYLLNVTAERDALSYIQSLHVGRDRSGTGDIFSSIVAAEAVKGGSLSSAVEKAASFVKACILKSDELEVPIQNGVCFEELLGDLIL